MQRVFVTALLASALGTVPCYGQVLYPDYSNQRLVRLSAAQPSPGGLGGGFIEAVFGGGGPFQPRPAYAYPAQPQHYDYGTTHYGRPGQTARLEPGERTDVDRAVNPIYHRQVVDYAGNEQPGTIIIDTPKRFLYLVQEDGKAVRYGIGVGRPGFTWAGVKHITNKREWPDWRPPDEMLKRRPDLPRYMAGGPDNPLGARAMYLGSSLYRIHGSNEPWTIGTAVSSGCIRMRNEDVIDLYGRVKVGTKVVVI
jgi:lipoprotein-anchoring transpeptidase ErfK/SrfK